MSSSPRFINYFACLVLLVFSVSNLSGQSARERSGFDIAPDEKAMEAKRALLDKIAPIGTGDERPPNIVLILADDLGFGDYEASPSSQVIPPVERDRIRTPHIKAMANAGLVFDTSTTPDTPSYPPRTGLQFDT